PGRRRRPGEVDGAALGRGRAARDRKSRPARHPAGPGDGPPRSRRAPRLVRTRGGHRLSTEAEQVAKTNGAPRPRSSVVFDGPERAFARAYMKGIGFDDDDLSRPTVGIANTWIEAMPCNFHLRGLAEHVKEGVRAAGGTPLEFNSIAISDGITMGTEGMKTSLVSREVI